jgi:hypothetical protein
MKIRLNKLVIALFTILSACGGSGDDSNKNIKNFAGNYDLNLKFTEVSPNCDIEAPREITLVQSINQKDDIITSEGTGEDGSRFFYTGKVKENESGFTLESTEKDGTGSIKQTLTYSATPINNQYAVSLTTNIIDQTETVYCSFILDGTGKLK